ncbi:hypothetical protein CEXT_58971 [Caerostris extrusa]|uniref:Uncharacterized protein n=1 Tax=Caerostris extrusa TaxID=172846 RepID=A0AAV4QVQ3_CAEEX|nr:hypothetical protein CEXT_58971 [Caerostris extrusa]
MERKAAFVPRLIPQGTAAFYPFPSKTTENIKTYETADCLNSDDSSDQAAYPGQFLDLTSAGMSRQSLLRVNVIVMLPQHLVPSKD